MSNFVLTLTAPDRYDVELFGTDPDIWTETDAAKTTTSRYTGDGERASVMAIQGTSVDLGDGYTLGDGVYLDDSALGADEGAYKDYTVTAGAKYNFSCFYRSENARAYLNILLYDQTNGADVSSNTYNSVTWASREEAVVIPASCTTLRVKFRQSNALTIAGGPFYVDNVAFNENALTVNPESYSRLPVLLSTPNVALSGRKVYDLRGIHYTFSLIWPLVTRSQFEKIYNLLVSGEVLYFDDEEVPPLIETAIVYDTAEEDFVGVTNPSSTHKAYYDESSSLPSGESDFNTNEYSTANYQAVDVDDGNYLETTDPADGEYLYHRFEFDLGIAQTDVRRFRVKVVALSDDSSPANTDGCVLSVYNHTDSAWVVIARSSSSAKTDMTYSTADFEVAQQYIDGSDDYVRFLLRSRALRDGANSLSLRTHYVECEINEGLDLTVSLSHKAILDSNDDVIWVKNLTQGSTLVLDTDYTIASDRRSVGISGQASGDEIEIKYSRWWEVVPSALPEEWLEGDPDEDRDRKVSLSLETLSQTPLI